jgi:hypothetical protein
MIVVRDIFRIKFGKTKEATALWKQAMSVAQRIGYGKAGARLLTDLAGPSYYTLILETMHESLAHWESASRAVRADSQWQTIYQQITPLTDEGRREILSVVQ